jgi:hypothetical protein
MSENPLLQAHSDSGFARPTSDKSPVDEGDLAKAGYTHIETKSAATPAQNNRQIKQTKDSIGSLGNDGTSRGTYELQPDETSANDGPQGKEYED